MSYRAAASPQLQKYLENVARGPAPAPLKAAAQAQVETIISGEGAGANDAATDRLADAIADLPGTLACHLDFMRLLHGESVQHNRHCRTNMAAVLRDKARCLGRPPVEADFSTDHPVRVFALAYWGGVAAWSAGSGERIQHAKGYWSCRQNQITAIQSAVARYPGVPVTHVLLRNAGLHRLAVILDVAKLALLADEAGLDRALAYKVDGWWTADRVIDAYAEECRRARVTLSSWALTAIGGQASSLRVYAVRHFENFRAFQSAVIKRHPDILPARRPVAADGTRLNSWSEVVAYHALREAFRDVHVAVHVRLPGEKARSGDFLIAGWLWVEVLGLARDKMKTATSKPQMKYAAQWKSKLARYEALGVIPIVIEPADIYDPQRLAERIGKIARQLGVTPPPAPPPTTRIMRAKGTWTFDALCQAVNEVAGQTGKLPTHASLTIAGYGHAAQLLRQPGERQRVATALGLHDAHRKGVWTQARVAEELVAWSQVHGKFPTKAELRHAGRGGLSSAIGRLWAGDRAGLRIAVEKLAGTALPLRRAANRTLTTQAQWAAALKPLADELGRMPSCKEAIDAGLSTAWTRASRSVGVAAMARLLGVPQIGPIRRSPDEMLQEFANLAQSLGTELLTTTMIRDSLGSGGLARLRKCGGIASVRAEIDRLSSRNGQTV